MKECNVGITCGCSCCEQGIQLSPNGTYFKYICDYFARPHKEVNGHECIAFKTRIKTTKPLTTKIN